MKFIKGYLKYTLVLLILILTLSGCTQSSTNTPINSQDKSLMLIHYIDVGQADSILIQVNGKNMLIDAGNRGDADTVISYLQKQGVKKLDYVIATHPHEDHIGAMSDIIKKFPISEFYAPKKTASTKTFENMINALNGKKIIAARADVTLDLGENTEAVLLAPNNNNYEDINNYSAVLKLKYGSNKFLFMGDAEKLSEKEILNTNSDISADVIKVGHHGSTTSSSKEFLDKAAPKIVVISVGKDNDYGHPHKETLAEFKKRGYTVYRTDIDSTIVLQSDGKNIKKR
ncbi:MBL fold metallo-hydrolase [Clostridium swellfunianum]|uniref:ComEC/Rec2 family competence protein n=1 Tax=Clostridium swellfunianum TaxID=1367462 RepID=UPI00202EAD4C|nr:ComEC/Rec2 family competence protein [Clostridium swellfunianum]MCM0650717.1 MBL fold metallo-hydrolase [Clostridium swellfunianum]